MRVFEQQIQHNASSVPYSVSKLSFYYYIIPKKVLDILLFLVYIYLVKL